MLRWCIAVFASMLHNVRRVKIRYSLQEFVATLAQHVLGRFLNVKANPLPLPERVVTKVTRSDDCTQRAILTTPSR
jgi:hypothetical protein